MWLIKLLSDLFRKETPKTESLIITKEEPMIDDSSYKIKLNEYLKGRIDFSAIDLKTQSNIADLLKKINQVRNAYGKGMIVTSGFRSKADQIRIYKEKGITDLNKIPMGSRHLSGEAIDIYDPKQELQSWCLKNIDVLESIGLWMEDFSATPNWCHFQTMPPRSGNRFFKP